MRKKIIILASLFTVLSCNLVNANVDINVTATVPNIFDLMNAFVMGNGIDIDTVELLDAVGHLKGAGDRTVTFTPPLTQQAKVTVTSANFNVNNCRLANNGNFVNYTVTLNNGGDTVLQHGIQSAALNFTAAQDFTIVFDANDADFTTAGQYRDTATFTFAAP